MRSVAVTRSSERGSRLASRHGMTAERIDPDTARAHVTASQALLVCAYDDPEKCRANAIAGALGLDELEARASRLPRDQEIIFYCA